MTIAYAFVVLMILGIGTWWIIFLSGEGRRYAALEKGRFQVELGNANAARESGQSLEELATHYPNVDWSDPDNPVVAQVSLAAVDHEARRRTRMFLSEGITLMLLLLAGTSILGLAHRAEVRYRTARDVFLEQTAHDLRTPLASLQVAVDTLQRTDLKPEQRAMMRKRLEEDTRRLHLSVEQMLSAGAGLDEDEPFESLDLGQMADAVVAEFRGLVSQTRLALETSLPTGYMIRGRRVALSAAVRNLLDNALKYAGQDGTVRVRVEPGQRTHELVVEDTGPGIPPDQHEAVFRRFVRSPGNGVPRGSGLGLYLAKRNVEAMGGHIDLSSESGRGATFRVVLPAKGA